MNRGTEEKNRTASSAMWCPQKILTGEEWSKELDRKLDSPFGMSAIIGLINLNLIVYKLEIS